MALADDLANADIPRPGPRCSVGMAMARMTDEEQAALAAAFDREDLPSTRIAAILQAHDYDLQGATVHRHRTGRCRCPRNDDSPPT